MPSTQLVSYNFSTIENPLSDGGNFTTVNDAAFTKPLAAIAGNLCEATATGANAGSFWSGLVWPNDQYSEVTIATIGVGAQDFILLVRQGATASGTQYALFISTNPMTYVLYRVLSGAFTLLTNASTTVLVGDIWRLSVIGTNLSVLRNGAVLATVSDNHISSGSVGFGLSPTTNINRAQINLWAGGSNISSDGGLGEGTLMGSAIIDLDGQGFPIAESQVGTLL